jgi:hypothetical protein
VAEIAARAGLTDRTIAIRSKSGAQGHRSLVPLRLLRGRRDEYEGDASHRFLPPWFPAYGPRNVLPITPSLARYTSAHEWLRRIGMAARKMGRPTQARR